MSDERPTGTRRRLGADLGGFPHHGFEEPTVPYLIRIIVCHPRTGLMK